MNRPEKEIEGRGFMAGHSKWANRKHRKSRQDEKRGKLFSKMARAIAIATRQGGPDPEANPTLRALIDKAKSYGVPNDNIERAIRRGSGDTGEADYEEFQYEGYGPGGAALLLDIVTDNRNRTASEVRHIFSRHGGNLGESGCVAWMFERRGLLVLDQGTGIDEDDLFLLAAEVGAEELEQDEDAFQVITAPDALEQVRQALLEAGYTLSLAEVTYLPKTQTHVCGGDAQRLLRLIEALEDHDDVQEVYGNFDIDDEELDTYVG